jgi:hypothetical protein
MGQALPYWQLYVADSMEPAPLSIDSVSLFFRYALSLTALQAALCFAFPKATIM